jgi:site-specific DNA recombinase
MKTFTSTRKRQGDPKVGVALLRVSTEDQQLGPEAQRRAITAWAEREGVRIVAWHVEQGVGGATPLEQRAILLKAIDDLKTSGAGRLVVAKRDRLARDVVIAALIERLVERCGARVFAADGTSDATGPEGLLLRGMVDLFAAYERLIISSRTKAALGAKRAKGERIGGVPFGFSLADDGRMLVESDREQAILKFVRGRRAKGDTLRAIVVGCARRGLVSRAGRPFALRQVARMLEGGR